LKLLYHTTGIPPAVVYLSRSEALEGIVMEQLVFILVSALTFFQVSAGQAPGSAGRTEVPDPMQIDVPLGADIDGRGKPRESFERQPLGVARAYPETDNFVCDQAHVRMLTVKKTAETPVEVVIEAALTLMSDWSLQDVDLTVSLVGPDNQVVGHKSWNDLTLGTWSRSYKPPKAEFRIPAQKWTELFANGSAPRLLITVDIQE
jgi:hypothetical protein